MEKEQLWEGCYCALPPSDKFVNNRILFKVSLITCVWVFTMMALRSPHCFTITYALKKRLLMLKFRFVLEVITSYLWEVTIHLPLLRYVNDYISHPFPWYPVKAAITWILVVSADTDGRLNIWYMWAQYSAM